MPELSTQLKLTQSQKLAMTQTLRQQLEILQMPSMELEGLIATELAENPLLEEDGNSSDQTETDKLETEVPEEEPERSDSKEEDPLDILREIDEDVGTMPANRYQEEEQWHPEAVKPVTLSEHLISQLQTLDLTGEAEDAGVYIIYSLDRHGLLTLTDDEFVIGWDGRGDVLQDALSVVRSLDPPGVAQRSARDALLFQMLLQDGDNAVDTVEYRMIDMCFDDLAQRRILNIASELGVSPHEVEEAIQRIKKLNPWPGAEFSGSSSSAVVPDVIIEKHNGKFLVFLNDNRFPHLAISSRNRKVLESPSAGAVEKEYVTKKFRKASWFIKAIRQRQQTVIRISRFITEKQNGFLENGVDALVPLRHFHDLAGTPTNLLEVRA